MTETKPAGPPVVGIDLSATNLQFGVVDAADTIVGRTRGKTEADDFQPRFFGAGGDEKGQPSLSRYKAECF